MWSRAVTLLTCGLALTVVLGWFGSMHALFELLTNAPTQLLAIGVVLLLVAALRRQWLAAAVATAAVAWFAWLLLPYWTASPDPRPETGATTHTVQQYNVYFGNDDIDRIAAEIRSSDAGVVALHEITTAQWLRIQDRLPEYPHSIAEPWDGGELQLGGGMALISRAPLDAIAVDPAANVPGRPILAASTEIGGDEVVVVGLHPHASRFESHKVDLRDAQLQAVVDLLSAEDRPAIILTDLNMTPTSSDYRSFLAQLDWRDPHRVTGWDSSWPNWGGAFGLPIDHVFVSNHVSLHDITTDGGGGSDHRSVTAELSIAG